MSAISILDQAEFAEGHLVEYQGHINHIRSLKGWHARPPHEIQAAEKRLPIIAAIARTLRALADNPAALDAARSVIRNAGEAP